MLQRHGKKSASGKPPAVVSGLSITQMVDSQEGLIILLDIKRIPMSRCEQAVSIGNLPSLCKVQHNLTGLFLRISSLSGRSCDFHNAIVSEHIGLCNTSP
jgi:hypothetical protein